MKGNRERINVTEAIRLMIKQIAVPLQILSEAEVLLRARHAVGGSINYDRVEGASAKEPQCLLSPPTVKHPCKIMQTSKQSRLGPEEAPT